MMDIPSRIIKQDTIGNCQNSVNSNEFCTIEQDPEVSLRMAKNHRFFTIKKSLELCIKQIDTWYPDIGYPNIKRLEDFFNHKGYTCVVDYYISFLTKYLDILGVNTGQTMSNELLSSGFFFFCGGILLKICEVGKITLIEDIFDFMILYMLVDHYLDNKDINDTLKNRNLHYMHLLIENPHLIDSIHHQNDCAPFIINLVKIYNNLSQKYPHSLSSLKKIFYAEVEGIKIQKNPHLPRNKYLDICEKKGGLTTQAVQSIIGVSPDQYGYDVGACVQLVDDILDVNGDIENGIHTIATHELKTNKSLDQLIYYTVNKIYHLSNKYNILKPPMMMILIYVVRMKNNYTNTLREKFQKYPISTYKNDVDVMKMVQELIQASLKQKKLIP